MTLLWILICFQAGLVQFVFTAPGLRDHHACSKTDCSNAPKETVCGTNGKVYTTRCDFNIALCAHQPLLETICKGILPTVTVTVTPSTESTRSTTHTSHVTTSQIQDCLTLAHKDCPDDYNLVCGSDGLLYSNLCEFRKARCMHSQLTVENKNTCLL